MTKPVIILILILAVVKGTTWAQIIDSSLIRQLIEKNESVLGLTDTSLTRESKDIRLFNLTDVQFDSDLLLAFNPVSGNNTTFYKHGFTIDLVQNKKFQPDINTGRYRDLFIVSFKTNPNKTISIATLAFVFKSRDCLNQNKILGDFEFLPVKNGFELRKFRLGAVD